MAMTERARTELHERLDQTVGPDAADTLMGYLPPVGWADVATRTDLEAQTAVLRSELHATSALLRSELTGTSEALRSELHATSAGLRGEMGGLATTAALEATEARLDRRISEVEVRFERALRQAVLAVVTTSIASVGLAVTITQLLHG